MWARGANQEILAGRVGPRGHSGVALLVYDIVVIVYNMLDSLSLAVPMMICSISMSDMLVSQFEGRTFRRMSLSMIADLTTSYHLSLGLPTLLCPVHMILPLGCIDMLISYYSGDLNECAKRVIGFCFNLFDYFLVNFGPRFLVSCRYYLLISDSRKVCMFDSKNVSEAFVLKSIQAFVCLCLITMLMQVRKEALL